MFRLTYVCRHTSWIFRGLVVLGVFALLLYYSWWWHTLTYRTSIWLTVILIFMLFYGLTQLLGSWLLYLSTSRTQPMHHVPSSDELTVDVFITVCGEHYSLIERALAAACALRGQHRTWVLDDCADPNVAVLARQFGAGYLTRSDRTDAKAGNLNAALARTTADIVAIFDVDHIPDPAFLERTLGYFADPKIGFVQVMLTFRNSHESWIARAAAETSLDFYNPTSIGMDRVGGTTLMGSNALIRRTALESIGGYQPGLAEDLATSLALHAAGWNSAYVAEPLAPGLVPADLAAWFTQQLKWARGVFEVLLTEYPRSILRLTWGQRLSYAVRMTKYLIGPIILLHLLFTIVAMLSHADVTRASYQQYVIYLAPLVLADLLIRQVAMRIWRHPSTPLTQQWRAIVLIYATWPIYTLAWGMAMLRMPLAFRPTPKNATGNLNMPWLFPYLAALVLLILGMFSCLSATEPVLYSLPLFTLAGAQAVLQVVSVWHWKPWKRSLP